MCRKCLSVIIFMRIHLNVSSLYFISCPEVSQTSLNVPQNASSYSLSHNRLTSQPLQFRQEESYSMKSLDIQLSKGKHIIIILCLLPVSPV